MQKGFSSIFLVIGLLVIALIGGAIYLGKTNSSNKQSIPSSSPQQATQTPSSDKTADWKTYTNTDYAYQLKYPKTLNTKIPENAPQVFIIYLTEKQDEYLEVEIGGISSLGLDKEIEFDMQRANPSKTTFQNKPAVSVRPARNIYPGEPFKTMIIYLEDKKFKIELGYYGDGKNEALFDQILATLQLMNQSDETENWKTYTNNKAGFSFKYPGDHTAYAGADQQKPALIPATPTSDTVNIAAKEDMVFCCEPVTLSFSVKATTKKPREWAEEYLKSIPEWEQELPVVKDTTFAGKPAIEASGRGGYGPPHKLIVTSLNGSLLVIIQNGNDSLLNEVLSTVKFN